MHARPAKSSLPEIEAFAWSVRIVDWKLFQSVQFWAVAATNCAKSKVWGEPHDGARIESSTGTERADKNESFAPRRYEHSSRARVGKGLDTPSLAPIE